MVMGPVVYVIIKLTDIVDFVFCLNSAMLSEANINPCSVFGVFAKVNFSITQSFICTINANAPGPGSAFIFFLLAVSGFIKGTYTSWSLWFLSL